MVVVAQVVRDLGAEHDALDTVISGLNSEQWGLQTASPGWTVQDQVGHLTYFDDTARLAITDPAEFAQAASGLSEALAPNAEVDMDELTLGHFRAMDPADVLERWRTNRRAMIKAAESLGEKDRVRWYGPSMGSKSFLTARLMETWAHGRDIADAVGVPQPATDRLAHIARLGFNTRAWSYVNRGLEPPVEEVAVNLTSPSGQEWNYGDQTAVNRVTGSALDFCLVTTQRRHPDDTDLDITGYFAYDWMVKAQAFAGQATDGPAAA